MRNAPMAYFMCLNEHQLLRVLCLVQVEAPLHVEPRQANQQARLRVENNASLEMLALVLLRRGSVLASKQWHTS